jgi:hypothetical protein
MGYGIIFWFCVICGFWIVGTIGEKKCLAFRELVGLSIPVVIVIAIIGFKLYGKYELEKFENIHNNDAILTYIDTMSVVDLRNKLKACQIDSSNCTIVFPQSK